MSNPTTSRSRRVSVPDSPGRACSRSSNISVSGTAGVERAVALDHPQNGAAESAMDDRRSITASAPARTRKGAFARVIAVDDGHDLGRRVEFGQQRRQIGACLGAHEHGAQAATLAAARRGPGPCARSPTSRIPTPWVTTWMRPCRSNSSFITNAVRNRRRLSSKDSLVYPMASSEASPPSHAVFPLGRCVAGLCPAHGRTPSCC